MQEILKVLKLIEKLLAAPVLLVIRVYQKIFSFDHSFWSRPNRYRVCIYHPSCSEYTYQAIKIHGLIKGLLMGTFRVLRCNPLSMPGNDPVPDRFSLIRNNKELD